MNRSSWLALFCLVGLLQGAAAESRRVEIPVRGAPTTKPRESKDGVGEASDPRHRARPNLVLITLDTTRADYLGAWGRESAETPHLDDLAARGTRFERCDASSPLTLPSHASLMTGLYPPRHGVRDNGGFILDPQMSTVAELLRGAGYETAAVISASVLARGYGLNQGFETYDDDLGGAWARAAPVAERSAAESVELAKARLRRLGSPFFLWLHLFDAHDPYEPALGSDSSSTAEESSTQRAYAAEITRMDRAIGDLLVELEPLLSSTVILVVGDHGEMLGEHGEQRHGLLPFAGVRRVPLMLAGPAVRQGFVVEPLVRTIDVAPSLLELAGVPIPAGLDGSSFLGLIRGRESATRWSYWESFYSYFAFGWYPLRALSNGELLYVQAPRPTLYGRHEEVLAAAARTGEPVAGQLEIWRDRLGGILAQLGEPLHGELEKLPAQADEADRLASLGYLGAFAVGGARISGRLPDPRDFVDEAEFLQSVAGRWDAEQCRRGLPRIQSILERHAENPAAQILAGRCLSQQGDHRAAARYFRSAGELPVALDHLAEALLGSGRQPAAEGAFGRSLEIDPANPRAAAGLARLLRKRGATTEALEVANGAIEAGARAAEVYFERALAANREGLTEAALADFEEALRRDSARPAAAANAARLARELGRWARAAELYEMWLRQAPRQKNAWSELAQIYERLDRPGEAARCYRRLLTLEIDPGRKEGIELRLRQLGG